MSYPVCPEQASIDHYDLPPLSSQKLHLAPKGLELDFQHPGQRPAQRSPDHQVDAE